MNYRTYLDIMTDQYLDTADWADGPEDDADAERCIGWSRDAMDEARRECAAFLGCEHPTDEELTLYDYLTEHNVSASDAGHDLWLTRNRHGVGFWDRGLGEVGDVLTREAHAMGSSYVIVDTDGWQQLLDG